MDDIDAGITHVLRGEDLLSSTPRQLAVYRALGAPEPLFAHLPMILGPDKKKLSKRHGAVSVEEFRDRGYLAETMRNYLALIGWSFDDKTTVMTTPELVERCSIERVSRSPGVFDVAKLERLNGSTCGCWSRAVRRGAAGLPGASGSPLAADRKRVAEVAPVVQDKRRELSEFEAFAGFLFGPVVYDDEAVGRVLDDPDAPRALSQPPRRCGAWWSGMRGRSRRRCAAPARKPASSRGCCSGRFAWRSRGAPWRPACSRAWCCWP